MSNPEECSTDELKASLLTPDGRGRTWKREALDVLLNRIAEEARERGGCDVEVANGLETEGY